MRRILHSMGDTLRTNWGGILLFEMIYRLFSTILIVETASHGIRFALKRAGFSYLTAKNALRFLCSPMTILVLLGLVLLILFLICLEMCVLYTAFQAGVVREKMSPVKMLVFGIKNLWELFQTGNKRVILLNINFFLLTQGWICIRLLGHVRPLSYLVAAAAGIKLVKILKWVLLAVLAAVAVSYLYVPVIATLRDISFREATEKGRKIFRRCWIQTLALLLCANGATILFYYGVQFLAKVIATLLVVLFANKSVELALILTISHEIEVVVLIVASVLGLFLNQGIMTFLLYRYQNPKYQWEIPPYHYQLPMKVRRLMTVLVVGALAVTGAVYAYDSVYTGAVKASSVISAAKITSHRGNSYEAPENTIPAIQAAIDNMSDYAEIDVQETKDGVVVVYHDATLRRITGDTGRLWEYTYEELLMKDFGKWYSDEFEGTQIPTLAQVLELCKGKINLNIELKANKMSDTLVDKVLALIEQYSMENQVVLSSTSYRYLREAKERQPSVKTGYILMAAYGYNFDDENIDFFSIRSSFVTQALVENAHGNGKEVHAWTVNTKSELSRLKRLQVDNIITDRPVLAREILYREKDTEGIWEFFKLALKTGK